MENLNQPKQVEVLVLKDDDYYKIGQAIKSKKYNQCIYIKLDNQDNGTKFYFENDIMYAKHLDDPLQQVWPQEKFKQLEKAQNQGKPKLTDEDEDQLKKELKEMEKSPEFLKDFEQLLKDSAKNNN